MGKEKQNILVQRTIPCYTENGFSINVRKSPLPMQYLGSKGRISEWIINNIKNQFPEQDIFFDLFAGSGSVSCSAMANDYKLFINDVQPYSYIILKSIFKESREGLSELSEKLTDLKNDNILLSGKGTEAKYLLDKERRLFKNSRKNNFNWKEYQDFCDNTPIVKNNKTIEKIREEKKFNLFIKYYANTYFGIEQCLILDSLREFSETLNQSLKLHLIASVLSVMTYAVSSTTHLAQYLKPNSNKTTMNIIKKRQYDIINEVKKRLLNILKYPLPSKGSSILNLDFLEALNMVDINQRYVIYLDPPYFKEHYSRYYHLLDTFYLYDYPKMTYNHRLKQITVGRYRNNRIVSRFGLRGQVQTAFLESFVKCRDSGAKIALSYADTSLVEPEKILEIAKKSGYKIRYKQKKLMHSGQGQPRNKNVKEYLYLLE